MRVLTAIFLTGLAVSASGQTGQTAPAAAAEREKLRDARQKALECYGRKDWKCFLDRSREAYAMDPASTRLLYILACAEAKSGDVAGAAKHLDELLDRKVGWERGDDLADIREKPELVPILRKLAALKSPVSRSAPGFRLAEKDLVPEGIAFDPKTRAFFVSSVHHRKIVRRAADGAVSDFVPEARDGLEAVLALRVDRSRGLLWAGAAALPEMRGWTAATDGASTLWAFELESGKLARRIPLAVPGQHALNDLAIAANGDVYATDSLGGGVYRLKAGADSLEVFVPAGVLRSAQGIGFSPDGRLAYVADWGEGVSIVDVATGRIEKLTGPKDVALAGVDALVARGNELVVTQNGIFPKRVARWTLDPAGRRVVRGEILEMNTPDLSEPTLGVLAGDDFYYVANAQWDAFDGEKKVFPPEKLKENVILKVRVGPNGP